MKKSSPALLIKDLRQLLISGKAQNQEVICRLLADKHPSINQSKVSRLLRKIGAVKVTTPEGEIIYALPKEPPPPAAMTSLENLVINIVANESMAIINTSPGSASLIARMLDHQSTDSEILGTIAGDDTVAVFPRSIERKEAMLQEVKQVLGH